MDPSETDTIKEKDLAAQLQVDRSLLVQLRKGMERGVDWFERQGVGIHLTVSGQQKIKAALPPVPPPLPVAAGRTVKILRLCPNELVVECEPIDGEKVFVRLLRGPSANYRPGMLLPGCTIRPGYTQQWDYPGPRPRYVGRF